MSQRRAAILALYALTACHHLPPDLDQAERRAARLHLGPHPEADARAREEAGDPAGAVDVRRAIVQARPRDAAAWRELVRAELVARVIRRAGLDAEDFAYLSADRSAAETDLARLYGAAGLPRPGIRWIRLALAYAAPRSLQGARLAILARLALDAGDPAAPEVLDAVVANGDADALAAAGEALARHRQADRAVQLLPPGPAHARALLAAGDAAQALAEAGPLADAGDPAAGLVVAAARLALGERAVAQGLLEGLAGRADARSPVNLEARLLLAGLDPARAQVWLAPLLEAGGEAAARAVLVLAAAAPHAEAARRLYAHAASDSWSYDAGEAARARLTAR